MTSADADGRGEAGDHILRRVVTRVEFDEYDIGLFFQLPIAGAELIREIAFAAMRPEELSHSARRREDVDIRMAIASAGVIPAVEADNRLVGDNLEAADRERCSVHVTGTDVLDLHGGLSNALNSEGNFPTLEECDHEVELAGTIRDFVSNHNGSPCNELAIEVTYRLTSFALGRTYP